MSNRDLIRCSFISGEFKPTPSKRMMEQVDRPTTSSGDWTTLSNAKVVCLTQWYVIVKGLYRKSEWTCIKTMMKFSPEKYQKRATNDAKRAKLLESYDYAGEYVVETFSFQGPVEFQNEPHYLLVMDWYMCDLMELARGARFREPSTDVVGIMKRIAECLRFLHDGVCVVHGNLTLESVVVVGEDRHPHMKLKDFENCRHMNEFLSWDVNAEYCPPELASEIVNRTSPRPRHQHATLRASGSLDVWSYGVLWMKFLKHGDMLDEFQDKSDREILAQIADETFHFEATLRQLDVPEQIKDLIRACTNRQPGRRPRLASILQTPILGGFETRTSNCINDAFSFDGMVRSSEVVALLKALRRESYDIGDPAAYEMLLNDWDGSYELGDPTAKMYEMLVNDWDESVKKCLLEHDNAIATVFKKWPDQWIIRSLRLLCHHEPTCRRLVTEQAILEHFLRIMRNGKEKEAASDCVAVICNHLLPELHDPPHQLTLDLIIAEIGRMKLNEPKQESISTNERTYLLDPSAWYAEARNGLYASTRSMGKQLLVKKYKTARHAKGINEAKRLEALAGDNRFVVEAIDFSERAYSSRTGKCAVLVMERGKRNLRQEIDDRSIDINEGWDHNIFPMTAIKQVATCLDFLHSSAKLVHGDVRLENVVDFGDTTAAFKLIDFESCRQMDEPMSGDCDPEYCPPELARQLVSEREVSLAAHGSFDVWCFGVLWIKCFLHQDKLEEFKDKTSREILETISKEDFSFEQTLHRLGLLGPTKDLLRACTQLDPSRRPSFREILSNPCVCGYATTTVHAAPQEDKPSSNEPKHDPSPGVPVEMVSLLKIIGDGNQDSQSIKLAEEQLYRMLEKDCGAYDEPKSMKRWLLEQDHAITTLLSKWPDRWIKRILRLLCNNKRTCSLLVTEKDLLVQLLQFVRDGKDKEAVIECLNVICDYQMPELDHPKHKETISQLWAMDGTVKEEVVQQVQLPQESVSMNGRTYDLLANWGSGRNRLYETNGSFGKVLVIKKYASSRHAQGVNEAAKLNGLGVFADSSQFVVDVVDYSENAESSNASRCAALVMEHGQQNLGEMAISSDSNASSIPTLKQIANCLDFLHSQAGLVHGDVRLENLVNFGETTPTFKLIDFENCRRMGENVSSDCDPEYCPPELARQIVTGGEVFLPANGSFDVWCFGVLWMKCLMNGRVLLEFRNKTPEDIHRLTSQPDFSFEDSLHCLGVSSPTKDLLRACTQLNPAMRPSFRDILSHVVLAGYNTQHLRQRIKAIVETPHRFESLGSLSEESEDELDVAITRRSSCDENGGSPSSAKHAVEIARADTFVLPKSVPTPCSVLPPVSAKENEIVKVKQDNGQKSLEYLLDLSTRRSDGRNLLFEAQKCGFGRKLVMVKIYLHEKTKSQSRNECDKMEELMQNSDSQRYIVEPYESSDDEVYANKKCSVLVMQRGKKNLKELVERYDKQAIRDHMIVTMKAIAECLQFLHCQKQMVHGDVKLENVVDFGQDHVVLKLIDFENCCRIHQPFEYGDCTPEYCPPENSQSSLVATGSYDVWCFGVLWMKYLVQGRVLAEFEGCLPKEITTKIFCSNFSFESTLNSLEIAEPVKELILRCTDRNPERRPTFCELLTGSILGCMTQFWKPIEKRGCPCQFCIKSTRYTTSCA